MLLQRSALDPKVNFKIFHRGEEHDIWKRMLNDRKINFIDLDTIDYQLSLVRIQPRTVLQIHLSGYSLRGMHHCDS